MISSIRLRLFIGTILVVSLLLALAGRAQIARSAAGHAAKTFKNPVYAHNFPDPFVLKVGKTYYAYGTGTCSENFQVLHSQDLVHWTKGKDPLPRLPVWAAGACNDFFRNRMTWAPEVLRRNDGRYVMYYVAHSNDTSRQCVSHAVAKSPGGPFVDDSKAPFVCQASLGGSIDPDAFRDSNGTLYLLWKNDGNCCSEHTYIWAQKMSSDGLKLVGKAARLNREDDSWEGNLIEAPTMVKHGGSYYLFYSANDFASRKYAVGYATCKRPMGPCKDNPTNPVLHSRCAAAGPGGQAFITDAKGQTWIAYHAWQPRYIGDNSGGPGRLLWLDRLNWVKGKAIVKGPTCGSQPAPTTGG